MQDNQTSLPPEGDEEANGQPHQNDQPGPKQDGQPAPGQEPPVSNHVWYSQDEMLAKLQMHPNTLKKHRNKRHIGYSKPGAKFFYTEEDYQKFLMRFYKGPLLLLWALAWLSDSLDVVFLF